MDLSAKLFVLKENPYLASLPPSEARELVARLRERHIERALSSSARTNAAKDFSSC
jgi:hypothetical protein